MVCGHFSKLVILKPYKLPGPTEVLLTKLYIPDHLLSQVPQPCYWLQQCYQACIEDKKPVQSEYGFIKLCLWEVKTGF